MTRHYLILFFVILSRLATAQQTAEEYGKHVYELITTGSKELNNQFIDLNQYATYIDNLQTLEEHEKENMKYGAQLNYTHVRHDFENECSRILRLYTNDANHGTQFTFEACTFNANKNFPNLGMVTCYYMADIPKEEEPVRDALVFECIKTESGWRILDGFFDETYANRWHSILTP